MAVFRARAAATQSVTLNTETEVTLGTEIFDPDSVFASNRFTVPAGLNGHYAILTAGVRISATATYRLLIQRSTDSGSSWTNVVRCDGQTAQDMNGSTGPILLTTGHIYRLAFFSTTGVDIANDARTFFAGQTFALGSSAAPYVFKVTNAAQQSITATTDTVVTLPTDVFDAESVAASGVLTIPAGWDGLYADLFASAETSGAEVPDIRIWRSTDGGSTYPDLIAENGSESARGIMVRTGPFVVSDGDKFRVTYESTSSAFISDLDTTFFSGVVYQA